MKIMVNGATGAVTVDEAENLKALSVELRDCTPERADALLGNRELGRIEGDHAWLDISALRAAARPPRSCTWDERFQRAMAYAQQNGWTDPAGDVVRAHLEPSAAEAEPRPADAGPRPKAQPSPQPAANREP